MNEMMNHTDDNKTLELFPGGIDPSLSYNVYLATHPGKVRRNNEDNFIVNNVCRSADHPEKKLMGDHIKEPLTCAVFDGMGGEANGELASRLSAEAAVRIYYELKEGLDDIDASVCRFTAQSNHAIIEMLENTKMKRGGSTFVMTVFKNGAVFPYSLGDSRIYLFRRGALSQITNDQTLAMKKFRANIFTWEEAQISPDRHKLTSFLGVDVDEEGLEPQIYQPIALEKGDKLLLCSDGLYDMCTDEQIAQLMANSSGEACLSLMECALQNGGEDNITCIVVERA